MEERRPPSLTGRRPARRRSTPQDPALRTYVEKLDRYRSGRDPLALLRSGPGRLARAVRGLTRRQMLRRPARGKWSILEILGHLHDTEVVFGYRWRLMAAQPGAPVLGFDQATWTRDLRHQKADPVRYLHEIALLREVNLGLLGRIPRRVWAERYGLHSERGEETLARSLELIAGHDLNHIAQIEAIREKYGW